MLESVIVKENKFNVRWCERQDEDDTERVERQDTIGVRTHIIVV